MPRPNDAQRALKSVEDQLICLSAACQYQDECRALSELLQATQSILQFWQDNSSSIQDAKVKSAGKPQSALVMQLIVVLS